MKKLSLQAFLDTTFSKFGLLYSISLPQSPLHDDIISKTSDPTQPSIPMKTEYGFVTFYSSLAAKQALLKSKNTLKFGGCSIKVSNSPFLYASIPLTVISSLIR